MNADLQKKIELFATNRQVIGKSFKIEDGLNYMVASLILTELDKEADVEKIKESRKILASKTSVFSSFRNTIELAVITKMSACNDPEGYIDQVIEVYKKILGKKIIESYSYVLGAMSVVDLGRTNEADAIAAKAKEIMERMGKEHPFLTDDDDEAFAVLLAMTDKSVDQIINDMEECYNYLKKTIKIKADSNSIQSLCELIALSEGSLIEKCDKTAELFKAFKEHGAKYGSYYEFASLGALIGLDMDKDELVDTIIETSNILKTHKGFSGWTLSDKERLMFAAMLVTQVVSDNSDIAYKYAVNSAVIGNTVASIIAAEIAAMICVSIIISQSGSYYPG